MTIKDLAASFRGLDAAPELKQPAAQSPFFKRASTKAQRVAIGGQTFYLVEGDLLLDEVQLARYAQDRDNPSTAPASVVIENGQNARLLGIKRNGKIVRWKAEVVLTFYVAKETFPTNENYEEARESVRTATEDWMAVCGVQFEYRPQLDSEPTQRQGNAVFSVIHYDAGGKFIAAAFFPDDPPARRVVLIDPSFYTPGGFDKVGVLRHELGHVLGFRHEHIRSGAPPGCPGEPLYDTVELGEYDPKSVMHYFCGGAGTRALAITDLDRGGAQRLYGQPLAAFELVE